MKYRSHNAKRDQSEPAIVDALELAGNTVLRELPVDLLVLKRVSVAKLLRMLTTFDDGTVLAITMMEVKTAQGKRNPKARLRKDQKSQNDFCDEWKILKPTTPVEALIAAGETVEIS